MKNRNTFIAILIVSGALLIGIAILSYINNKKFEQNKQTEQEQLESGPSDSANEAPPEETTEQLPDQAQPEQETTPSVE